jgi:hypothetical protein
MRIPFVLSRQVPTSDLTFPIAPQTWHFRQSIDYSITAHRAILDFASRWRETVLFNVYQMGRNSIARGSTDTWTPSPHRYAALAAKLGVPTTAGGGGGGAAANPERDERMIAAIRDPQFRDPRGYIIPSSQADFPTAVKFINALREVGIGVQRATREFTVNGRSYPAGSFVVMTAQAFRPHIIDMFEPQDHPDNIPYPGAPPTPPYDHAGWTLAFQMGVEFDRILDGFTGPFAPVTDWNVPPPAGRITAGPGAAGYVTSRAVVDSFRAINRLLAAGERVSWLTSPIAASGRSYPAGTWYIAARPSTAPRLEAIARELGVGFHATAERPPASALRLATPRVGLWDHYGGSMDAGWARWILEQFEFPFERVFVRELDAGRLRDRFDVLVFVGGAIPSTDPRAGGGRGGRAAVQPAPDDVPEEYRGHLGRITAERTVPRLAEFVQDGGTIVAIGDSAANLAGHLALPVRNPLVEDGAPLPRTKYYVPGSVLSARIDTRHPLAHGMKERTDVFFDNSPVFAFAPGSSGLAAVAAFDSKTPLRSGWAWGQHYLEGGLLVVEATAGRGRVVLVGPEIIKRAQPHGTFPLLFNAIHYGAAMAAGAEPSSRERPQEHEQSAIRDDRHPQ